MFKLPRRLFSPALCLGLGLMPGLQAGLQAQPLPTPGAPSVQAAEARVIVKLRAGSLTLRAQTLAVQPQAGPQRASVLGRSLGLALKDGRPLGARTQVVGAEGLDNHALVQRLAQHPDVEWVVEDRRRLPHFVPNDPLYGPNTSNSLWQWYLKPPNNANASSINAEAAWDRTTGNPNLVVAVVDSGVRPDHPDLQGKLVAGYDFVGWGAPQGQRSQADAVLAANDGDLADADASDPGDWVSASDQQTSLFSGCAVSDSSWHGTRVAGLIGAAGHNSLGMTGLGGQVMVMPVRVLGKCGGFDSDIIAGMRWAAGLAVAGVPVNPKPVKLINLSLGGGGSTCGAAYSEAMAELTAAGVTVVSSAGNEGKAVEAPASCPGVIAVAALTHLGARADYSSLGPEVALAAPGGNCVQSGSVCLNTFTILTTSNAGKTSPAGSTYTDSVDALQGTSFAAPLVTGTVALMQSLNPALTPAKIRELLLASVRPFPSSGAGLNVPTCQAPSEVAQTTACYCTRSTCGAGMLDAASAVAAVQGPTATFVGTPTSPQVGQTLVLDGRGATTTTGHSLTAWTWTLISGSERARFDGATNTAQANLTTLAAGDVVVELAVTDDAGQTASSRQTFTITSGSSGGGGLERRGGGGLALAWALGLALLALALPRAAR